MNQARKTCYCNSRRGGHPSAVTTERRRWSDGTEADVGEEDRGGGASSGEGNETAAAAAASSGVVRTRDRSSTGRFRASALAGDRGSGGIRCELTRLISGEQEWRRRGTRGLVLGGSSTKERYNFCGGSWRQLCFVDASE